MSGGPAPLAGRPTLLQQAAAQGNVTLLSMLLNEEGLDINYSCEDGHSALYSAAKNGHTGKNGKSFSYHNSRLQKDGRPVSLGTTVMRQMLILASNFSYR